jgi:adenine-specific DNA-methyltransferase
MNPGIDAQSADKSQKRSAQERLMEKLKLHTPDLTAQNIDKLAQLFPNCVTETRDEKGNVTQAIDFDQLRQELSGSIVEGPRERYHLDWPGKREAILAANAPIAKTLRPCRAESVDFDTTKNLFIEGDNLDALKLLQETYLGKVKLIYIDPPYNTGNDFIYEDDFAEDSEAYFLRSNQKDESGNRMVANTEANGRFHSDWLSMLYPRLRLAKNLMSEEGAIFVSIADQEVHNLRFIMNEVFGAENFVATIIWQKVYAPKNSARHFSEDHDYIVVYARNADRWMPTLLPRTAAMEARYTNPDKDPRGVWKAADLSARNYYGEGTYAITCPSGRAIDGPPAGRYWAVSRSKFKELSLDNRIWWGTDGNNSPAVKKFLSEVKDGRVPQTLWTYEEVGHTQEAKKELLSFVKFADSDSTFETPKPTKLLKRILQIATSSNDDALVLDFFAGSGSMSHATFALNAEDGGNRRAIAVQIAESLNLPTGNGHALQTIADVCKERIRNAGTKIKSETALTAPNLDTGFRVLKIDTSNMRDVYYAPDAVAQGDLLAQVDNIRQDRTPEDLLFQVLVDQGVDLALPIAEETITGKKVFFVDGNALAACFDSGITDNLVKEIAKRKPLRAVFRDSSYGSDSVKINVDQIFRLLSPDTEVKSI